ncbi:geranylgeranylglycerol-phosphate geranylgeranyltransferase [Salibacteraceae bacterium]|jgi:4-hydroxybenzoate polyprenyltransferase|nr:geranylgeranylglycerol-phosphate geranylgeranyltransferase [Flavobacteriales bacterium]MDB9701689.1 geranylgeranylglycerol-phosphate geranylgeranyltransferase [Salibacteraceae bacterium]
MVIFAYLRLVRIHVLVLIALIQYATRHFLIEPMLTINGYSLQMSDQAFAYLVLASVLIAAGGYTINDYFDTKVDRINKPKSVLLDRIIKRRMAMALHIALTGSGFLLACYLSYALGMWKMSALFIFAVFSLWFYSTTFKHQLVIGNLLIAILAASIPMIVGLFEIPLQNAANPEIVEELGYSIFNIPAFWTMGFAVLLGLMALAREVSKDVVDMKGDKVFGGKTIPIELGIRKTKSIIIGLYAGVIFYLLWIHQSILADHGMMVQAAFWMVFALILVQFYLIFKAKTKKQFAKSVILNGVTVVFVLFGLYAIQSSILYYFQ